MLNSMIKDIETIKKDQSEMNNTIPEMKNTISEMKNTLKEINSRSDEDKDQINDLEYKEEKTPNQSSKKKKNIQKMRIVQKALGQIQVYQYLHHGDAGRRRERAKN